MKKDITRRDFLNASLLGAGGALLTQAAPLRAQPGVLPQVGQDWYGYGGIGDYAISHGNTPEVVNTAHAIRAGYYDQRPKDAVESSEIFDVIVVGCGMAGLGAAWEFRHETSGKCLVLDNHPVFGGVSKQNEFEVAGQRLISPSGCQRLFGPRF